MGFNVPTLGSRTIKNHTKEAHALSLLSDIADGGLSARFERHLIRKLQILNSVSIRYNMLSKVMIYLPLLPHLVRVSAWQMLKLPY